MDAAAEAAGRDDLAVELLKALVGFVNACGEVAVNRVASATERDITRAYESGKTSRYCIDQAKYWLRGVGMLL